MRLGIVHKTAIVCVFFLIYLWVFYLFLLLIVRSIWEEYDMIEHLCNMALRIAIKLALERDGKHLQILGILV